MWQTALCIVVAEGVMVAVAWLIRNRVNTWGRKPLFLAAFAALAVRAGLTTVSHAQIYLISLQSLDGLAPGTCGVLLTLVIADLARGSGRFNFLQGIFTVGDGLGCVPEQSPVRLYRAPVELQRQLLGTLPPRLVEIILFDKNAGDAGRVLSGCYEEPAIGAANSAALKLEDIVGL